jgi:hypothetical protein
MSQRIRTEVSCDGESCGKVYASYKGLAELRHEIRLAGGTTSKNTKKDFCPDCAEVLANSVAV